jgi:hypothetical protein
MLHLLKPHPDFPCPAVTSIAVEVERGEDRALALRYVLTGRIAELAIPAATSSRRADELWRHTCFEAFLRPEDGPEHGEAYFEFNLAPSTEWAAYRLSGYREGLAPVADIAAPRIEVETTGDRLILTAAIDLSAAPELAHAPWRLGLSAVIEAADGSKAYWALAHAAGKPDFHHPDCFALRLQARDGA